MVLNELRIRIQSEIELDAVKKKSNPIQNQNTITMKKKAQNSIADKLGFPDGMTYGQIQSEKRVLQIPEVCVSRRFLESLILEHHLYWFSLRHD